MDKFINSNVYGLFLIDELNWLLYHSVINFLALYDESTKYMEAQSYPTLSQSISVYTGLYDHSETFLTGIDDEAIKEILKVPIESSQGTLTEMFNRGVLLSFCAMILHPRIKTSLYLNKKWNTDLEFMLTQYF